MIPPANITSRFCSKVRSIALAALIPLAGSLHGAGLPEMTIPESLSVQMKDTTNVNNLDGPMNAGFKFVRCSFQWASVEPLKGTYDFSDPDSVIPAFQQRGIRMLVTLCFNNRHYNDHDDRGIVDEENRIAFANYAAAMVARYGDDNIIWEIWNEPNLSSFWQSEGSSHSDILADEYTALVKTAVPLMRAADPNCKIVVGSISALGQASCKWLNRCVEQGIFTVPVDGLAVHPYGFPWPELFLELGATNLSEAHNGLRRVLADHKIGPIPILSTEVGYSMNWIARYPAEIREDAQGWMFVRNFLVDQIANVRLSSWYQWKGSDWGVVNDDWTPRSTYIACQTLVTQLQGCDFVERISTDNPRDYIALFESDTAQKLVVWTTASQSWTPMLEAPHDITIPVNATGSVEVCDVLGNLASLPVANGSITVNVTGAPVYITLPGSPVRTPTRLAATVVGDSRIDLAWQDQSSDETGFAIERKTGAGSYAAIATTGPNITTFSNTGLAGATDYTYRVRSLRNGTGLSAADGFETGNWTGGAGWNGGWTIIGPYAEFRTTGAYSGTTHVRIRGTTSAARSLAAPVTGGTLTFAWKGGDFEAGDTGTVEVYNGSWNTVFTLADGMDDNVYHPATVDLSPYGTITQVRVSINGDSGDLFHFDAIEISSAGGAVNSNWSNASAARTKAAATQIPDPPTDLIKDSARAIDAGSIEIRWVDNSQYESGFKVSYKTGSASGTYTPLATLGSNVTSFVHTGLTKNLKYNYRIQAYNAQGTSPYAAAQTTIENIPPSTPANLLVEAASSTQIELQWGHSIDNARVTGYRIFRGGVPVGDVDAYTKTFMDSGLSPNTNYSYTVAAFDQAQNVSIATPAALAKTCQAGTTGTATDSFETANWSGGAGWNSDWSLAGQYVEVLSSGGYGGVHHARMRFESTITRTLLQGRAGGTLSLAWKASSLEDSDYAEVQVFDGQWRTVLAINELQDDNVYHPVSIDLSAYGNVTRVRIRMYGDGTGDSLYVDEINIQ